MVYDDLWNSYPPDKTLLTTLSVENFGPIAKAEVQLRPLTVLVGPSDTGKSYLSTLIYALHNFFSSPSPFMVSFSYRTAHRESLLQIDSIPLDLAEQVMELANEWWLEIEIGSQETEAFGTPLDERSAEIIGTIGSMLERDSSVARTMFAEIERCFGVEGEISQLSRYGMNSDISIHLFATANHDTSRFLQYKATATLDRSERKQKMTALIPASAQINVTRQIHSAIFDVIDDDLMNTGDMGELNDDTLSSMNANTAREIIEQLLPAVLRQIGGPLGKQAYYLPADRGGLMHVHREVLGALISDRHSAVPGPLRDFVRDLATIPVNLKDHSKNMSHALADRLERDVLGGTVRIERSESGYPSFRHRPTGWTEDLALTQTSSKTSELASLALYLRYYALPGETIIIDEPESHLHPEAQVAMATFLARLVNAGYRVIIATHSDWILEQLANLVRMSNLTPEERKDLDGADAALTPEQFGAWLFRHDTAAGGTMVEEIDIDPEGGGLVRDYRQVLDETYNTWAEIGNRIADREE